MDDRIDIITNTAICNKKNQPWCYLDSVIINNKKNWGRVGWLWGHKTAIKYSDNPTQEEKNEMIFLFWNFIYGIPCVICRSHAFEYTQKNPPQFSNSQSLQIWFFRFHNAVNLRLGKPILSIQQYNDIYKNEINKKMTFDDAYNHLKRIRPFISPNPNFIRSLRNLDNQINEVSKK